MSCPLVFACDAGYAPHLATALRSAAESNRTAWPLECHVLSEGIPEQVQARIHASLPAGSVTIRWTKVDLAPFRRFATMDHITPVTYARLLLPELFAGTPRVLYLDADILVLGDLGPLREMDLGGAATGAVLDEMDGRIQAQPSRHAGIPRVHAYFNAGVLLIDLERWRTEGIAARALDYLAAHPDSPYSDQDALNVACEGRWLDLGPRWNYQHDDRLLGELPEPPAIVHFVSREKPWRPASLSRNAGFYDAFRSRTAFARTRPERMRDGIAWGWHLSRRAWRYGLLRALRGRLARGTSRREGGSAARTAGRPGL